MKYICTECSESFNLPDPKPVLSAPLCSDCIKKTSEWWEEFRKSGDDDFEQVHGKSLTALI